MTDNLQLQLQKLVVLTDSESGNNEGFEQIGPILQSILRSGKQNAFKAHLQEFIKKKEHEIEKLCAKHYEDFVKAVDDMMQLRQSTTELEEMNLGLQKTGLNALNKNTELLELRQTYNNADDAIDTMNTCLHVARLANRVKAQIGSRSFYTALRSIEELKTVYLPEVSQYSFAQHMQDCIPYMENNLRETVWNDMKDWLYNLRTTVSHDTGRKVMQYMAKRQERWAQRERRGPVIGGMGGGRKKASPAIDFVLDEDIDEGDPTNLDLQPLYQCLHIYDKLGRRSEFKEAYQADRRGQADLVLSTTVNLKSGKIDTFQELLNEIVGFFVIEYKVMTTTQDFRSKAEVEALWDLMVTNLSNNLAQNLQYVREDNRGREKLRTLFTNFIYTAEGYSYDIRKLKEIVLAMLSF